MKKYCRAGDHWLPTTEFYADKRCADGLKTNCKACHSAKSYESRKKREKKQDPHERYEYHRARMLKREKKQDPRGVRRSPRGPARRLRDLPRPSVA